MRYCKVQPEASLVNWPQALTERRLLHLFLFTFLNKWQKMISCARVYWILHLAVLFILGCVLLLSKWNLITRYPVIFNFRVGTGWVLEKKSGMGRVPGSRRTLPPRFKSLLISFIEFNTRADRESCALSNIDDCQRQTSNCSAVSNTVIYLMHWVWLLPLDRIQFWQTRTGFLCIALSTIHCWLTYLDAHIMYIVKTHLQT